MQTLLLGEEVVEVALTAAVAELSARTALWVKRPAREGAAAWTRLHLLTTRVWRKQVTGQATGHNTDQIIDDYLGLRARQFQRSICAHKSDPR